MIRTKVQKLRAKLFTPRQLHPNNYETTLAGDIAVIVAATLVAALCGYLRG
jgi:hypothetical protein